MPPNRSDCTLTSASHRRGSVFGTIDFHEDMNVTVRNTFVHLSNVEEKFPGLARSTSAPELGKGKSETEDCDAASVSTRCQTLGSTGLSSQSDLDDRSSQPSDSEAGDALALECAPSKPDDIQFSGEELQQKTQQVEAMSQKVMDIWSTLRSVEARANTTTSSTPLSGAVVAWMPVQLAKAWTPCMGVVQQKLDRKAPSFTPTCKPCEDPNEVLDSIKHSLASIAGVESVEVRKPSVEGSLATVAIKIDATISTTAQVKDAAQTMLLEAATNSQSTYVLGYEAEPFKDLNESTFVVMLAALPPAWNRTACWDTYSMGACPRGKSCKWQHPGKREMQPVRVTLS